MNQNAEISIIMPVYNAEKYLRESIESILRQTYRNFVLYIINDGSSDNSEEIILSFKVGYTFKKLFVHSSDIEII